MSRPHPPLLIFSCVLIHSVAMNAVQAAVFCANTAAGIQTALNLAASNGQSDSIRIVQGSFSGAFGFEYSEDIAEDFDLTVSGGWDESTVCGLQSSSPLDTSLSPDDVGGALSMNIYAGNVLIENLTITGARLFSGLSVFAVNDPRPVNVTLERIRFVDNLSSNESVARIRHTNELRIRNSVFHNNDSDGATIEIEPDAQGEVYFTNNTVVSNTSFLPNQTGRFNLIDQATTQALIANNIFWGNDGIDLDIQGPGMVFLENNNIEELAGVADQSKNNLSVDPDLINDLAPSFYSAMIDAGTKPPFFLPFPIPFDEAWSVGPVDFNGDDREQGQRVDIGAVEAFPEIIFFDGYE